MRIVERREGLGKHPTPRITDNLELKNVPPVCASDTAKKGDPIVARRRPPAVEVGLSPLEEAVSELIVARP